MFVEMSCTLTSDVHRQIKQGNISSPGCHLHVLYALAIICMLG